MSEIVPNLGLSYGVMTTCLLAIGLSLVTFAMSEWMVRSAKRRSGSHSDGAGQTAVLDELTADYVERVVAQHVATTATRLVRPHGLSRFTNTRRKKRAKFGTRKVHVDGT